MGEARTGDAVDTQAASPPVQPADQIRAIPVRHWGRWVGAVFVVLLAAWVVVSAASSKNIEWSVTRSYIFDAYILQGLANTIFLSVISQAVGIVLGVVFAVMRLSRNPVLSAVSSFYIWFFRGTPVLVQLLVWFSLALVFPRFTIAIPFTDITLVSMPMNQFMTPLMAAFLGLGLNEGAYMAEIVRGGIISVDEGQTEAALALGMSPSMTMRRIVLPQAMRVIIPPTGNEFISMLKTSSLASVVVYGELLQHAKDIYSTNLKNVELLFTACFWYLVLTSVATVGQYFLERRYARGTRRGAELTPLQRIRQQLLSVRRDQGIRP